MKYFSTFSGVGGFEIGIKEAMPEAECVGFSEVDKHASAVLRYRFPNVTNYGDITKIDWSTVPDFDLLVGGSPCQDFSVAGKRAGIGGKRSGLFHEYIRSLEEKKPSYFIWENVKGVMSSNEGRDFAAILNSFSEAGYSLWWQVLNAKDFGVPQNRERIFVFGSRTGSPREVLFEREGGERDPDGRIVAGTVTSRYPASQREGAYIEETRHGVGEGIKIREATKRGYAEANVGDSVNIAVPSSQTRRGRVGKGIANTIDTSAAQCVVTRAVLTPDRLEKRQNGRRMKEDEEPMFTLNVVDKHGVYNGTRIRKLTPVECSRLMSWPDDWTRFGDYGKGKVEMSDSQRYKMCGNGVVSKVVAEIIKAHLL